MKLLFKEKIIAVACCLLPLVFGTNSSYGQTDKKYKLVWQDEFNYTGLPDPHKWRYEVGFVRNGEPQYYTQSRLQNCRVENGALVIEALKEKFVGQVVVNGKLKDTVATYTSASINTQGLESWKYGRIEVRAKVPKGLGSWSAAWLLGENHGVEKWPFCGEIDLMEYVGKDSTRVYGTVHYPDAMGRHHGPGEEPVVGQPWDGFHVYAIDWDEDHMSFYYDNNLYFTFHLKDSQTGRENVFKKKFYLLLNLALGRRGTLGGPLDDHILPIRYEVDYVRVYQ